MISPKVSVIVPNYNHAPFLKQRIESILEQTYQHFELILLDDQSTDESVEILNFYKKHPKVSGVYINPVNSGNTFRQWKKGFEQARGEYIWIAESDDYAHPQFLEILVKKLESAAKIGIAFSASIRVDKNNNIIKFPDNTENELSISGKDFIKNYMGSGNAIYNASMAVFRKSLLKDINDERFLTLKYCGDWYFWILISQTCEVFKTNNPLNYFRRHEQSVSSNSEKAGLFFIEGRKIISLVKPTLTRTQRITLYKKWAWNWSISSFTRMQNIKIFILFLSFPLINLFFLKNILWLWIKREKGFR